MRKRIFIIITSVLPVLLIISSAFQPAKKFSNTIVDNRFKNELSEMSSKLSDLDNAIQSIDDMEKLRLVYFENRTQYKKIEFLVDYLQPEFVLDYINGAPLPKPVRKLAQLIIKEPSGLQRIDELMFEVDSPENRKDLLELSSKLIMDWKNLVLYLNTVKLTDRHIFEAMRYELIRTYTLGVTGFDTPGSVNAMPDALVVMKSLQKCFKVYAEELKQKDIKLESKISGTLDKAVTYLKENQDFDSFDRLYYLKEHINPLYGYLLDAQLTLNIETIYEVTDYKNPLNYMSRSLFDEDFLNPYYYTNLMDYQNSDTLKQLGKLLFFDPILSVNGKRSCASCHNPSKAFTDGHKKSLALDFEGTVSRNAPTLINAVYADRYFYDLRASKLEEQFEHVVVNEKEFHTDFKEIEHKLTQSDFYKKLFKKSFPSYKEPIFKYTISMALSSYLTTLTSYNSDFDKYVRNEKAELSASVKNGYNLFMGKAACGTCHFAPNFSGLVPPLYMESESEILGIPVNSDRNKPEMDNDPGRFGAGVIREETEIYLFSFKTVTVRNVELTAPYMHNGVYESLEEVMEFYHAGGGAGLGFDLKYQTLAPDSLDLTEQNKLDLIAFMKSLTDTSGLTNQPKRLPTFETMVEWNSRIIGGEY